MPENVIRAYREMFSSQLPASLVKAINYLLKYKKAKNLSDIAKKTYVSPSLITAYMNGKKNITRSFIERFKEAYMVDLENPLSYEEPEDEYEFLDLDFAPIPHKSFLKMYFIYRRMIRHQQGVIEGLKQTNNSLNDLNVSLFDYIIKNEKGSLKAIMCMKPKTE